MATFTYAPDFPVQESTKPRVSQVVYPSYEHRTTFGLNPLQDTWELTFSGRTSADRDGIYSFLQARAGTEPFLSLKSYINFFLLLEFLLFIYPTTSNTPIKELYYDPTL